MLPRIEQTSIARLFEYAIPTRGSYRNHIGTVSYTCPRGTVYNTLVMTRTDPRFKVNGKLYPTIAGYLQVKPFVD
jgi:hypothetical protein